MPAPPEPPPPDLPPKIPEASSYLYATFSAQKLQRSVRPPAISHSPCARKLDKTRRVRQPSNSLRCQRPLKLRRHIDDTTVLVSGTETPPRAQVGVTQAFLPLLRRGAGRIVFMGSTSGFFAVPFVGAYGASKYALEGLADSWRA